ncbi:hemophore-related protein [Mycolicibacterium sp. P1-18]|uniref:heme-binding protein n=1 Tax=Mycolicibacterium sp. P1-18 TaxID=2024615 RepID=UPI0011F22757|nr:heme-binding protein [Mycolicibacterium sp. P1-18]KAA0102306.1 hemophore-related protein [Mycolicibacterium sp. P1-18]
MKLSGMSISPMRRGTVGLVVGGLFAGVAAATIAAPVASAAPDCSGQGVANTVSSVTGSARDYLRAHPGADQVVSAARNQPRDEAAANIRNYFTANPQEYYDLRGIIAPIGDTQRACNVSVLPPDLQSAYAEFMAG